MTGRVPQGVIVQMSSEREGLATEGHASREAPRLIVSLTFFPSSLLLLKELL